MFKDHDKKISKLLSDKENTDWEKVLRHHKIMILRIQHERLIHLIVMIFVGIVMSFSFLATIVSGKSLIIFLDIPLLILFTAYLFHYRFLENTTQKWYKIEDAVTEKIK